MEELTEPLQRALDTGGQVRLRDPRNDNVYVLMRESAGEKAVDSLKSEDEFADLAEGVRRSKQAFLRDLPALLQNPKYDRWCVVYHGEERIGPAPSEMDLLLQCQRRGLESDQYYVGIIAPHESNEEIEHSFYEFDPIA